MYENEGAQCEQNYMTAQAKQSGLGAGMLVPPSDRQRFEQKKRLLEWELAKVNAALKALDDHPELEEFTNVLQAAR